MKRQLLIILFFAYSIGVEGQSWVYHPFPTDSAIWTNVSGSWIYPAGWPVVTWPMPYVQYDPPTRYCMSSMDTIIGIYNYSKVDYCGGTYCGGLRDDGIGKIYFVPTDSLNELLIYDFTVQTGDTVSVYENFGGYWNTSTYEYIYVDSVLINGSYRKQIKLGGNPGSWIEGIGCTQGLFREGWGNVSGWYINLECMSQNDSTLYPAYSLGPCSLTSGIDEIKELDNFILYPNPTNGLLQIKTEQEIISIEVLDVFGRRMLYSENNQTEINISNFTNGIYFVRMRDSKGNFVVKKIVRQ